MEGRTYRYGQHPRSVSVRFSDRSDAGVPRNLYSTSVASEDDRVSKKGSPPVVARRAPSRGQSGGHLLSRMLCASAASTRRLAGISRHVYTVSATYSAMAIPFIRPWISIRRPASQPQTFVARTGSSAVSAALISLASESPTPGPSAATAAGGLGVLHAEATTTITHKATLSHNRVVNLCMTGTRTGEKCVRQKLPCGESKQSREPARFIPILCPLCLAGSERNSVQWYHSMGVVGQP